MRSTSVSKSFLATIMIIFVIRMLPNQYVTIDKKHWYNGEKNRHAIRRILSVVEHGSVLPGVFLNTNASVVSLLYKFASRTSIKPSCVMRQTRPDTSYSQV